MHMSPQIIRRGYAMGAPGSSTSSASTSTIATKSSLVAATNHPSATGLPLPTSLLDYTYGLTGVDQVGNYLWVHVTLIVLAILCVATFTVRVWKVFSQHIRHVTSAGTGAERQAFWAENNSRLWPWLKRNLVYAPIWKLRHNRELQLSSAVSVGTLPGRFHLILLVAYFLSNVAYCLVLPYDEPESASVVAALRGRSGVLATLNIIPTVLFALRNNPLIGILHVSYDTFNLFHRWIARLVILESIVHVLAWAVNAINAAGWNEVTGTLANYPSKGWGAVGFFVMIAMGIQAWSPIRHAFYETFLNFHRIGIVFAFVGVYMHLDIDKLPQLPWIWIALGLWIGEWLFRACRILYFNFGKQKTRVTVEALQGDACRVTFQLARPWRVRPGCHVHAYIPSVAWHSSHPFSVCWTSGTYPTVSPRLVEHPSSSSTPSSEKMPSEKVVVNLDDLPAPEMADSVSLICRVRSGMTKRMFDRASKSPNGQFTTFGAIEGPYGGHESLRSYGTVVIFAGGVGITYGLGQCRDLVAGYAAGTVTAQKILLVWSVPNTEALSWVRPFMDQVLSMPRRRECLRIMLYVTKPRSQAEVISGTGTVQMFPGRCKPQEIIDQEVYDRVGAMAVTVCGPGAFSDAVRDATRRRVEMGNVDFVEEAFTY